MKKKQKPSESAKNPEEKAEAANAAMRSQEKAAKSSTSPNESKQSDSRVDEAGEESFPASDPPAYSAGTATPTRED